MLAVREIGTKAVVSRTYMECRRPSQDIGSATFACTFLLEIVDSNPCQVNSYEDDGSPDTGYLFILLVYLQVDVSESLGDPAFLMLVLNTCQLRHLENSRSFGAH